MFVPCNFLTDGSVQEGASFVDLFSHLSFVFVFAILSCLFLTALWSFAGNVLTSWLSCMCCFVVFFHFPIRCSGSGVHCFVSFLVLQSS